MILITNLFRNHKNVVNFQSSLGRDVKLFRMNILCHGKIYQNESKFRRNLHCELYVRVRLIPVGQVVSLS